MAGTITTPEAFADVCSIVEQYESQVLRLGRRFKRELKQALRILRDHPEGYAVIVDEFRLAPIRRFPYVIAYTFADQSVTIHAVFNPARDPDDWPRLLRR